MARFNGPLHVLCEEAKWAEVKKVVMRIVKPKGNDKNVPMNNNNNSHHHHHHHHHDDLTTSGSNSTDSINNTTVTTTPTIHTGAGSSPSVSSSSPGTTPTNMDKFAGWTHDRLKEELCRVEGPHDWTPLMISCVRAPIDVIALLCHAHPRACLVPDKSGSLPVHFCATFRRGPFCEVLLNVLCEASPMALEQQNAWGQTPLHSLLDANTLAPIGCLRVLLDQGQYTEQALQIRDHMQLLPLHIAAKKALPAEYIAGLVEAYRDATCIRDKQGNLPCHLLHQTGQATPPQMEVLLLPLALGTKQKLRRTCPPSPIPSSWSQLLAMTRQFQKVDSNQHHNSKHNNKNSSNSSTATSNTPAELTLAQQACRIAGVMQFLPIHLGTHYGIKLEILKGICRQYPEGATIQVNIHRPTTSSSDEPWEEESLNTANSEEEGHQQQPQLQYVSSSSSHLLNATNHYSPHYQQQPSQPPTDPGVRLLSPLEIFEQGKARDALDQIESGNDQDKIREARLLFTRRADLLLSYNLEKQGKVFLRDDEYDADNKNKNERLARMERRIVQEAKVSGTPLSDAVARVWHYMCQSGGYRMSIGRIVSQLTPPSLWKLTIVPLLERDAFCTIRATGRTIAQEAELRVLSTKMDTLLRHHWFQYMLTSYMEPLDALNYSACCRETRAAGVRLLPQVRLRVPEASWKKPHNSDMVTQPKPWQRLDVLVVPDCTHTIFISYYIECREEDQDMESAHRNVFGGMLVVRDDVKRPRPNRVEPWGMAVVAQQQPLNAPNPIVSGSLVQISFPHVPGRSYGLWHYSRGDASSTMAVSDVSVRQLLHSCDPIGNSPLHLLLNSFSTQPNKKLQKEQISLLLAAKFGVDSVGDTPVHYALRCRVDEQVLEKMIESNPSALVDTDKDHRTPIHLALLLARDEPPSLAVMKSLLTPPGENALRLKDVTGRLPIHTAAEKGAGLDILQLMVMANVDGCYRTNKHGDLPLHLHLKSGAATRATVELLIRPMMKNETICKIGGSKGINLPLHIAAEFTVSFETLEKLLQTYGDAALVARELPQSQSIPEFALDIFERHRAKAISKNNGNHNATLSKAKQDVEDADFALRSDLIFVYNPLLVNKTTGIPYRSDRERIRRLENMIRREASQVGEDRKINRRAALSDMAKQAWIFLTSFLNPENPSDNYAGTVRRILRGLSSHAVDVLAHIENPKSIPTPNQMIKDCATPVCQLLIMSRLRFVGRYVLYDEIHPVHKSESCLVMKAKDHGLEDDFMKIMAIYDAKENTVEDDISDAGSEPPNLLDINHIRDVTLDVFLDFATKLGVDRDYAKKEILSLLVLDNTKNRKPDKRRSMVASGPMHSIVRSEASTTERDYSERDEHEEDEISVESPKPNLEDEDEIEVGKEAFTTFCQAHRLNATGVRTVVIKFMKSGSQFQREKEVRERMNLSGTTWPIVPILDDYSVDRIETSRRRDIHTISTRDNMAEDAISGAPENADELYALDIQEKNASVHNFALYKYAVVMPAGDRDLGEISQHEELGILQIRDYMLQIGNALRSMHDQYTIHGELKMENVVRFGKNLSLIDFDGSHRFGTMGAGVKMGGGSSKFSTGVLPPEMIHRIDLISDYQGLSEYEEYWRRVTEDAKDVQLLTPDDIQTISSVTRSLLAKADVARNLRKALPRTLRDEMKELYDGLEDRNDWKDILSLSLMTISFEDLPFSLNRCEAVDEFARVWNRLLFHSKLWQKVKPRITSDERFAYLIKTHDDIPDEYGNLINDDTSELPYDLITPSETVDVWGFGVLMFALCSGGPLFHQGFDGDLRYSADFASLFEWNKGKADKTIRENIDDPLAQDLLMKILVPVSQRLPNMEAVLRHPFFGPSSSLEAQHILERHEEEQLITEETVIIKRMTTDTRRRIERSMERQCKLIFDEEKIVVPTCLVVLPYRLERKEGGLVVGSDADLSLAVEIGHHLLEINKITAQLSFFLLVKRSFGNKNVMATFRAKLSKWSKRSRTEGVERASLEVLSEIGCGKEYTGICVELLNEGEAYAKDFLNDPMGTARFAISETVEALHQCYESGQLLYLVDEMNGMPVCSEEGNSDYGTEELVYPIAIDPNLGLLKTLLLPFMNLAVMKLTAGDGLVALTRLLGMPTAFKMPHSWMSGRSGLVHRPDKPSSIAEFAVLHEVMRRQEMGGGIDTPDSNSSGVTVGEVARIGDEMTRLEDFFRSHDPVRTFSDLHRVSDGNEGSPAIWTTEEEVNRIQGELELASVEYKLRELKREWIKKQKMQTEIQELTETVRRLRGDTPERGSRSSLSPSSRKLNSSLVMTPSMKQSNGSISPSNNIHSQSAERQQQELPESLQKPPKTKDDSRPKSKNRQRKKMRFRPYFGVC